MKKQVYVFDSYALLAYFQAEPGGVQIRNILKKALNNRASVMLSAINLGEIYYIIFRKRGVEIAQEIVEDISRLPIQLVDAITERVLAAAGIKARYSLSYADAFAVATAMEFSATIVTGDPEFKTVEEFVALHWI